MYNRIKPFDIVIFQIAKTGEIYAVGVVKGTHYDDQTPVWPDEERQGRVLYPWRVEFSILIFSDEPFISHRISIQHYIDGYGLGEVPSHEFTRVLESIKSKLRNVSIDLEIFRG